MSKERTQFPGLDVVNSQLSQADAEKVWELWVEHGGSRHGPHVETVTMPLEGFWRFIDKVVDEITP